MFMIGIDPHKGSHTAATVDHTEAVIDTLRVIADCHQREHLLAWAAPFTPRKWAVEGSTGMGALLAQQFVAAGEHVVDVPPKLSSRVRLLERGKIDKTDPNKARSAAIVAWHNPSLNVVADLDEHRVVLRLLADRDHQNAGYRAGRSEHDVEGVPQRLVQSSAHDLVEMTDWIVVEGVDGDGDDVVAADDTCLGQTVLGTQLDLGTNAADRSRNGCTCDGGEHRDSRIAREHTHRATSCRRTEICPVDVVAGYHAGAVAAARRRADWSSAGSAGWRRYARRSCRSASVSSSASSTACAPRRNSSERLVPRSAARASSRSTSSSSS